MNTPNAMTIPAGSGSVLVNTLNLPSGIIYKNRSLLRNAICWHKFIVSNTDGLSRDIVLKTILDYLHPLDLIPVFYAKDPMNSNSYFLARNCESAIDKLCKDNLIIDHPYNKQKNQRNFTPFKLSIILNFSNTNDVKIDVQKNVLQVLQKRFNTFTRTLNLDRFLEDPDLSEFCSLSQPKIMYFVLHISKNLSPEKLILSNNGIKLLNPLDVLIGLKLKAIDLRNNELSCLNDLSSLKHFHLKELHLDGNPLCSCDEHEYVYNVRSLCSTVEVLDGILLSLDKFPVTRRNFFCDDTGHDLVNQFLEYFFTLYDTRDRKSLAGLYHTDAMFSMTCVYLINQLSSGNAFLKNYNAISRNLKKAADLSKTEELLFRGRDTIINVFETKLPLTEHDPYSLTSDLILHTEKCAIIVVTGVFHEIAESLLDKERLVGFTRTFTLEALDHESKYVIVNEQFHVYNALTCQARNSFREPINHSKFTIKDFLPKPQAKTDYTDLVVTLGKITGLREDWTRKCLEECQYDLKKSLELFIDLYKGDKIPSDAFLEKDSKISYYESPKTTSRAKDSDLINRNKDSNHKQIENTETGKQIDNNLASIQKNMSRASNEPINPPQSHYEMVMTGRNGLEIYEKSYNKTSVSSNIQQKKIRGPSVLSVLR